MPISIQALGHREARASCNVQNFKDYVQFLPSVTMAPSAGCGLRTSTPVYMRGVATGGDGQAIRPRSRASACTSTSSRSPTIQGNLDIHMYDIARVEALAGPQGTLYGASSQAGTIRIITNKPDPTGFAAGYSLEANYVDMEEPGYVARRIREPAAQRSNAALRFVGWSVSDAGWVDNKRHA